MFSRNTFPKIVRQTPVRQGDEVALTVSTVQVAPRHYSTVVFDDSADKRHDGMVLPGHEHEGRKYGPYVIDRSNERAETREAAMEQHREALYAARTEQLRPGRNEIVTVDLREALRLLAGGAR